MKRKEINVKMAVKNEQESAAMSSNYKTVKAYYAENCLEFKIRALKAEGQAIKDYASANGCSVQALFLAAVSEYMEQGKAPAAVKRGRKPKQKEEDMN